MKINLEKVNGLLLWNFCEEINMTGITAVETKRLILRELDEDDFEDIHEFKSDPQVVKYLTWGPNSREQTLQSLRKQIAFQNEENRKLHVLAVEIKGTKKVIGNALFMVRDQDFKTVEIGYFINSNYWKQGYGIEIVKGLLDFGFNTMDVHRIYAVCDAENTGSIKLLSKIGFRQEGHFIKNLKIKGQWRDHYLFAMLSKEFINKPENEG
ncbi:GNAT family N-acetyltransferase [Bacillus selenatarsenatis]|uniref:GNAT family N-acetyltransferase n=2 Tax=Mesobacillus selenatarsenatis TaxID=388741 RepID=A0A846TFF4_9BACI|nr:GNAT family N-acetyltransferase [Mesobacillus selenatarsenatis]